MDSTRVLCLNRTFNKPCPVCEERQKMLDDGKKWDDDSVKALKPVRRAIYNVIDTENPDGKDYLLPSDFGNMQWQWQLGLGVDVFMFAIDVKYFGGINSIMEKDIQVDAETFSISSKSNLFEVTLGWKIF